MRLIGHIYTIKSFKIIPDRFNYSLLQEKFRSVERDVQVSKAPSMMTVTVLLAESCSITA